MLKLLLKIAPALAAGKELRNVRLWKNVQDVTNKIAAVLALLIAVARMAWPEMVPISDGDIIIYSAWIATGLGFVNSFLTRATTKKIGN